MKVKNLVIGDIIRPFLMTSSMQECEVSRNKILKKLEDDNYKELETGAVYSSKFQKWQSVIDESSITPMSEYYNKLGFKKKNNHSNKQDVYDEVKKLKNKRLN